MKSTKELIQILERATNNGLLSTVVPTVTPDLIKQLKRLRDAETKERDAMSLLIDASAEKAIDIYFGSGPPFNDDDLKLIFSEGDYNDAWKYAKDSMLDYLFWEGDDYRTMSFERKHDKWYGWLAKFTCALSKLYGRRLEHIAIWKSIDKAKGAKHDIDADDDNFECPSIGCNNGCSNRPYCPEHK